MSNSLLKSQVGRASAILTTGEVMGANLDLTKTHDSRVSVQLSFTKGSLTSMTVKFYVSMDGITFYPICNNAASVVSESLSDTTDSRSYQPPPLVGWKFFAASVQGVGTVTSSACDFTYRFTRAHF